MLQCEWCGTVFEDNLEHCPACNSKHAVGYEMENPVSRLPMEDILRVTGHVVWILGLIGGLTLFWNTDQPSERINFLFFLGGVIFISMSIVLSILFFGMGEILKRIIRIQRRVRAFSEGYHVATVRPSKRGKKSGELRAEVQATQHEGERKTAPDEITGEGQAKQ